MNKKGYVTIDTVLAMSAFLIIMLISISFFVYEYPAISLNNEVYTLSKIASIQGGLTEENISNFQNRLENNYGFIKNSALPITVELNDDNGIDYLNVTPLSEDGDDYLKREDLIVATLKVQIPSNIKLLDTVLIGLNVKEKIGEYYVFDYPVISDRY